MKTSVSLLLLLVGSTLLGFAPAPPSTLIQYRLKERAADIGDKYMSRTEVSNADYKEFLMGLIEEGKADLVPRYAPDLTVWERDLSFGDPYTKVYFSHPAFENYPVVGITHEAAEAYCAWLTMKIGDHVYGKRKRLGRQFKFRLPTQEEWETVARSDAPNDAYMASGTPYPRDDKGRYLFNHKLGPGDYAGVMDGSTKDYEGYMATAPVRSFPQSGAGIYNLAGNVAEMVAEPGISKGGSWAHENEYATIGAVLAYEEPTAWLGFRYVIEPI